MRILLSAVYPYIFVLLFISIPFDDYIRAWPNILLVVLAGFFPFVVRKSDLKKLISPPVILYLIFSGYLLLSSLFLNRFSEDVNVIGKVWLVLGLIILYLPINDLQKLKNAIVFSSLAAIVYSVYNFVLITHELGYFVLGDSPQVIEALLIDRIYLGLLAVLSILISFSGIRKNYHPLNRYHMVNILVNFIFILLIASRISIVVLLLVLIVRQFYERKKTGRMALAALAGLVVLSFFYVLKNKDYYDFGKDNTHVVSAFIKNSRTYEIRAVAWKCAADIVKEKEAVWMGLGFQKTEDRLTACYSETISDSLKREEFVAGNYNSHNQFLDFYLSAGLVGFLLFILFVISSLRSSGNLFFPAALLVVLLGYLFFENIFHRQIGAYYAGIIIILVLTSSKEFFEGDKENETTGSSG